MCKLKNKPKQIQPGMRVLIEGCRNQDKESQRLLYKHYYVYAYSICVRYTGSTDEARELLNDGFMKVFNKIDKYDTEKSFEGWLKRVLINTAIDHYRANKKHNGHASLNGHDREISSNAIDEISHKELLMLVQRLSPQYRTVFSLFVIDGFSHEDIAEKLNISVGTSKSNLSKARANLRQMLKITNKTIYEQYI